MLPQNSILAVLNGSEHTSELLHGHKQPPELFCKKGILKNFAIFTRKQLCWSLFLIKLQAFIIKRLQHMCFLVNIAKLLKAPILKDICEQLLLHGASTIWWMVPEMYSGPCQRFKMERFTKIVNDFPQNASP